MKQNATAAIAKSASFRPANNVPAREITTIQTGGNCRWLADIRSTADLNAALQLARREQLPLLYVGEGSNVLFEDEDYPGMVLRNRITGVRRCESRLVAGAGESLGLVIRRANAYHLEGLERLYGIPGTVAGAIVGNAGAYGQEIGERVIQVRVWDREKVYTLSADEFRFSYRYSSFKEWRELFLLECTLQLEPSRQPLQEISDEILSKRITRYPPGLKCPGSFFKNVPVGDIPVEALRLIPEEFIQFGKVPAGVLLDAAGARGAVRGEAQIAPYHANLFINRGNAGSQDILELARVYQEKVWERFRIRLEPEILIVNRSVCNHSEESLSSRNSVRQEGH